MDPSIILLHFLEKIEFWANVGPWTPYLWQKYFNKYKKRTTVFSNNISFWENWASQILNLLQQVRTKVFEMPQFDALYVL